jgi:hypothetical protein
MGGQDNWICSGENNVIGGGFGNSILSTGSWNGIFSGAGNVIGTEQAICFQTGESYTACSITGGEMNWIRSSSPTVYAATISGGRNRQVGSDYDWRAGSLFEDQ